MPMSSHAHTALGTSPSHVTSPWKERYKMPKMLLYCWLMELLRSDCVRMGWCCCARVEVRHHSECARVAVGARRRSWDQHLSRIREKTVPRQTRMQGAGEARRDKQGWVRTLKERQCLSLPWEPRPVVYASWVAWQPHAPPPPPSLSAQLPCVCAPRG